MTSHRILSMGGEGIGPEIVRGAEVVLAAAIQRFHLDVELESLVVGLDAGSDPFPPAVAARVDEASRDGRSAILFGAVSDEPIGILRQRYDLFQNLRPARCWPELLDRSPLRDGRIANLDMLLVRELVSGIYYGEARSGSDPSTGRWASQELYYNEMQVVRIVRAAFAHARSRRKHLTYVHKVNVVKGVFGLWGDVVKTFAKDYPDVRVDDYFVDNMMMQLVTRPADFDVIVADNMFGDLISDLVAGTVGAIGMLPSASLDERGFGLYESIGGTAPDIAGKDIANPISTILSLAMMFDISFKRPEVAQAIERAVATTLETYRTLDLAESGRTTVGTRAMAEAIAAQLLATH